MVWLADFCARLSHPSTLRMAIWHDAINAQGSIADSDEAGKVC